MEPLALLSLVIARLVMPLLQLSSAVRERALIGILTSPIQLPKLANLRLELHLKTLLRRLRLLCISCTLLLGLFLGDVLEERLGRRCLLQVVQTAAVFPGLRLRLILEISLLDALLATPSVCIICLCRVVRLVRCFGLREGRLLCVAVEVRGDEDVGSLTVRGGITCPEVTEKQLVGTAILIALRLWLLVAIVVVLMRMVMLTTVHHSLVILVCGAVVKSGIGSGLDHTSCESCCC